MDKMLRTLGAIALAVVVAAVLTSTGCGSTGGARSTIEAEELLELVDPETSLKDFNGKIGPLPNADKKVVGDALCLAIGQQRDISEEVKQEIAAYVGRRSGLEALRAELAESKAAVRGMKDKLGAVVDALRGSRVDVTTFSSLLAE